jgi:hypothetical protein
MALCGSGQWRQRCSRTTDAAPLELAGARQPEHSGEQNSLSFHPMQPDQCGELTWVVLEQRGALKHGTRR